MTRWQERENLVWLSATPGEKEQLLDTGLSDRGQYISLVRELGRKYAS